MNQTTEVKRKETELEVKTYLDRLVYAIKNGSARIDFQHNRKVDQRRDRKYTNRYTIACLFPDEDPLALLKRELALLTVEDYIETVKDIRFPKRSDMRVFGKKFAGDDVYIKIRVELVSAARASDGNCILVMSFHYSESVFRESDFPYRKD